MTGHCIVLCRQVKGTVDVNFTKRPNGKIGRGKKKVWEAERKAEGGRDARRARGVSRRHSSLVTLYTLYQERDTRDKLSVDCTQRIIRQFLLYDE